MIVPGPVAPVDEGRQWFTSLLKRAIQGEPLFDLSSEAFFKLGGVIDWAHDHRDKVRADAERIDDELRALVEKRRADYVKDAGSLDVALPPCDFDDRAPATFTLVHLQRLLVREAKSYHIKPTMGWISAMRRSQQRTEVSSPWTSSGSGGSRLFRRRIASREHIIGTNLIAFLPRSRR